MIRTTPTVKRASLREILLAMRAQLASRLSWDTDRILLLARKPATTPKMTGDQDILLRVRGFQADHAKHRDRHDCRILREISVILRTRLESDEVDRDDLWLTEATAGSIVGEEDICDALQIFFPKDSAGNHLTFEGLFVLSGHEPEKDEEDQGWGAVELIFGVADRLPMTQGIPF